MPNRFCGVDCSLGQSCPSGYQCYSVIVLTREECHSQADCRCEGSDPQLTEHECTIAETCEPDPGIGGCRVTGVAACTGGIATSTAACQVDRGLTTGHCECATNADCANDGVCVDGLCCGAGELEYPERQCVAGENRVSGACTCSRDSDCLQDVCDSTRRQCAISGMPCEPGAGGCGFAPCIDGGCLIGANCAPEQGLSCGVVAPRE